MIPADIVPLTELPLTATGKVDRQQLAATRLRRPEPGAVRNAPADILERELAQLWANLLGVPHVGVADNFFELGGHSLLAARMFAQIEDLLGLSLPIVALFQAPTIRQLAELIRSEGWDGPFSSIVPIQPEGSSRPLFLVAPAFAWVFRHLGRHLAPDQPLYGLRPLGLLGRDGGLLEVEPLASFYLEQIRSVQPEGPYFIGGLSAGGIVAYEMAQQLLAHGERVERLVLLDTFPPRRSWLPLPLYRWKLDALARFEEEERPTAGAVLKGLGRAVATAVRRSMRAVGLRPAPRDPDRARRRRYSRDLHNRVRQLLRAQARTIQRYDPSPYPGTVSLFCCTGTRTTRRRDLRLEWGELAEGGLDIHTIPGVHHLAMREPHVQVVSDEIRKCLGTPGGQASPGARSCRDSPS
jgi:thioesterase domain-containing protein